MELTMTNNFGFCELNQNEMMMVDGGVSGFEIGMGVAGAYSGAIGVCAGLGYTSLACAGICATIAAAPVVAITASICGAVSGAYGLYCIFR